MEEAVKIIFVVIVFIVPCLYTWFQIIEEFMENKK
jgi:hypothetical protein